MNKIVVSLDAIAAFSMPVQAADRGDVAAGIISGIIIGNILQQYGNQYIAPQPPVIVSPPVFIQPLCYWVQEPLYDTWGRIVAYRQVHVCRTR
jgi:hypothetical protein